MKKRRPKKNDFYHFDNPDMMNFMFGATLRHDFMSRTFQKLQKSLRDFLEKLKKLSTSNYPHHRSSFTEEAIEVEGGKDSVQEAAGGI